MVVVGRWSEGRTRDQSYVPEFIGCTNRYKELTHHLSGSNQGRSDKGRGGGEVALILHDPDIQQFHGRCLTTQLKCFVTVQDELDRLLRCRKRSAKASRSLRTTVSRSPWGAAYSVGYKGRGRVFREEMNARVSAAIWSDFLNYSVNNPSEEQPGVAADFERYLLGSKSRAEPGQPLSLPPKGGGFTGALRRPTPGVESAGAGTTVRESQEAALTSMFVWIEIRSRTGRSTFPHSGTSRPSYRSIPLSPLPHATPP